MTISVTQEDIDKAVEVLSERIDGQTPAVRAVFCPIAQALTRMGYKHVHAGRYIRTERFNMPAPTRVGAFERRFDKGRPVSPFSFRIPFKEAKLG